MHQTGLQGLHLPNPAAAAVSAASFTTCRPVAEVSPTQESSAEAAPVTAEAPASSVVQVQTPETLPLYTMRQVAKHDNDESCWIVVNGKVRGE
jgi:cytochrome b involved in lipid metabolism